MTTRLRLIRPVGVLVKQPSQLCKSSLYCQFSNGRYIVQGSPLLRRDFSNTVERRLEHSGDNNGTKKPSEKEKPIQEANEGDVEKKLVEEAERRRVEAQDASLKAILDNAAAEKRMIEEEALKVAEEKARQAAKESAEKQALENQRQSMFSTTSASKSSVKVSPHHEDAAAPDAEANLSSSDRETVGRLQKDGTSAAAPQREPSTGTPGQINGAKETSSYSNGSEDPLEHFKSRLLPYKKSLESSTEYIRSALPENLRQLSESVKRKDYHDTIAQLSEHLNNFTGYNAINDLKHKVTAFGDSLDEARIKLIQAKQSYEDAISTRSNTQKAINDLLQRKHLWTPDDVIRFTDLYRSEHANEQAEQKAKVDYKQAESSVEEKSRMLTRVIMERYHEEQVWSDKIRAASTYGTWGLVGVNVMAFLIVQAFVEPRRRRKQVERYEELVQDLTERGILPEKKQVSTTSTSNTPPSSQVPPPTASDNTPVAVGGALLGGEDVLEKMLQSVERQEERLDRVENLLQIEKERGSVKMGELVSDEDGSAVYIPGEDDSEGDGFVGGLHDNMAKDAKRSTLDRHVPASGLYFVYQDDDAKSTSTATRRDVVLSGLGGVIVGGLVAVAVLLNR